MDKRITEDELQEHDGQEGRPSYVAYRGKVYDVSGSKLWAGGVHQRRHEAGRDHTVDFSAAPHDESVLQRVPVVGQLSNIEPEKMHPLLSLYLDLHPHPIAVHFPVALTVVAAGFLISYLITGIAGLVDSAYYVFLTGVIMSPIAIMSGAASWWFNYKHKMTWIFKGKASLAVILFILQIVAIVLWALNRNALVERQGIGWLYFALAIFMVVMVLALGNLGGRLVFPSRRKVQDK